MCVATVFRFIYDRGDGVISIDVPYEFWLCVTSLQWMKELNEKTHTINYYYLFTEFCELVYFMFDWTEPMERRRKRTTLWLTFWKQHLYTICSACGDHICMRRRQQIYSENKNIRYGVRHGVLSTAEVMDKLHTADQKVKST